ncbi:MAG TPA: hypothetical protein PL047_09485, partial [Methanothrix sp.]|nr:hypothetical protein [Methanothrix sp.]
LMRRAQVYELVPVGRKNAVRARDLQSIAEQMGLDGDVSPHLSGLVKSGLIKAEAVDGATGGVPARVYWREDGADGAQMQLDEPGWRRNDFGWRDIVQFLPDRAEMARSPASVAEAAARKFRVRNTRSFRKDISKRLQYAYKAGEVERVVGGRRYLYWRKSVNVEKLADAEALKQEVIREIVDAVTKAISKLVGQAS